MINLCVYADISEALEKQSDIPLNPVFSSRGRKSVGESRVCQNFRSTFFPVLFTLYGVISNRHRREHRVLAPYNYEME